MSPGTAKGCLPQPPGTPGVYQRRRPERTVLYELVQQHLETWLARLREADSDADPVPSHVERELRAYLECGILACGFARVFCAACGQDFLVAFSCRGRGVCPSCTTRRMVETAAQLVDHVFPMVPVRQWVMAFPKRLRWFLHRDPAVLSAVLRIVLRAVERRLCLTSPGAPADARFAAVTFVQRFGSSLNAHTHFHCCIADGMFSACDGELRFHPATDLTGADVAAVQETIRARVLRYFARHELLGDDDAAAMLRWGHGGGFSLHAAVRIEAPDRAGLERLLRYCARPALSGARLSWEDDTKQRVRYTFSRPAHDGRSALVLSPLEVLDRLSTLIPPPRRHRHRYHGAFAPNAALRPLVSAAAAKPLPGAAQTQVLPEPPALPAGPRITTPARRRATYLWAQLLARIYECFPLTCTRCGAEMRVIGFITAPHAVRRVLAHIGEPVTAPPLSPARGPPIAPDRLDQTTRWDPAGPQPDPGFEFDQTRSW